MLKENLPIERYELPREEAIKFMKEQDEPYKVELIEDLPEDAVISFYKQGDFTDLCAGPHLMSTKQLRHLRLLTKPVLQVLTGEVTKRTRCLPEFMLLHLQRLLTLTNL